VDVRVILDKSQRSERYSSADFLANSGIPTWIDTCCAIAHTGHKIRRTMQNAIRSLGAERHLFEKLGDHP
jgi:hypothetical protein